MIRDASENIGQIGLRIDAAHLCSFDDGVNTSGALSTGIGATEEVIFATENGRSHAALGGVVAQFQPTVRQVAQQRGPSCEGIADGPGEGALAADLLQGCLENSFNSSNRGRAYWMRTASRGSGACPRTLLSMTNSAAIRSIASSAIGEAEAW